jgi:hypothetical protein
MKEKSEQRLYIEAGAAVVVFAVVAYLMFICLAAI